MKDNNNKLGYNCWSGTDYTNDTTGISSGSGCILQSSNYLSTCGEKSLKAIRINNSGFYVDTERLTSLNDNQNVTIQFDIYNPIINIVARILTSQGVL